MRWLACLGLALIATGAFAGEPLPRDRQQQILQDALNKFDEAVGHLRSSPELAGQKLRQAASGFQTLIDAGIVNDALELNLGNTYFRLGDFGRAILHYRRGLRFNPRNSALTANLDYSRNRVEPAITPNAGEQLIGRLLFWHYTTSLSFRFAWTLIATFAGWAGLAAWLRWRNGPLLAVALILIGLSLANGVSVGWQLREESVHPQAVILTGPQTLRSGRGEGYEPVLKQTLGAGVEMRILNERADWVEVELRDGHTGWLPVAALERV